MKKIILYSFYLFIAFNLFSLVLAENNFTEDFAIYTAKGERRIFSEILSSLPDAGVLLINFTSVDCKPCRKEIPELRELEIKYKDRAKLICVYSEVGKSVQKLSETLGVLDCSFVDPFGKIQRLFTVKSVPVTFLINKKSQIIYRLDGYTKDNMKDLESFLKEIKYKK